MLSADADLEFLIHFSALFYGNTHQLTHAALIDADERIFGIDPLRNVARQKLSCVVPR